ncbi:MULTISPECIES: hypothetical protein [unclassified Streptomyces]|uniref:hypothetical protein n=1 Tax=unclassified Streptomyces TaxID=2593676 RepID=UPI002E28B395|nr:hypothetical protein [Streptomyces sp. NBC_01429]
MASDDQHDRNPSDQRAVTPADAAAALDDIRRRQEQSGVAELRFGLSRPTLLTAALLLFVSFASYDLPNPWGGAVLLPGLLLVALLVVRHTYGAPVRNRPAPRAVLIGLVCGLAGYAVFRGLAAALSSGGVPGPHAVAAAVVVGAGLLVAPRARGYAEERLRRRAERRI